MNWSSCAIVVYGMNTASRQAYPSDVPDEEWAFVPPTWP
jgi:hypothetical protein